MGNSIGNTRSGENCNLNGQTTDNDRDGRNDPYCDCRNQNDCRVNEFCDKSNNVCDQDGDDDQSDSGLCKRTPVCECSRNSDCRGNNSFCDKGNCDENDDDGNSGVCAYDNSRVASWM